MKPRLRTPPQVDFPERISTFPPSKLSERNPFSLALQTFTETLEQPGNLAHGRKAVEFLLFAFMAAAYAPRFNPPPWGGPPAVRLVSVTLLGFKREERAAVQTVLTLAPQPVEAVFRWFWAFDARFP